MDTGASMNSLIIPIRLGSWFIVNNIKTRKLLESQRNPLERQRTLDKKHPRLLPQSKDIVIFYCRRKYFFRARQKTGKLSEAASKPTLLALTVLSNQHF
jgi:hypothetical protein